MARVQTFLTKPCYDSVKTMSEKEGKSISKMVSELVELGLKVKTHSGQNTNTESLKQAELEAKHTEYMIRTMYVCNDILCCIYDADKAILKGKTAREELQYIKTKATGFIDGYLQKDDS